MPRALALLPGVCLQHAFDTLPAAIVPLVEDMLIGIFPVRNMVSSDYIESVKHAAGEIVADLKSCFRRGCRQKYAIVKRWFDNVSQ